jgi:hypothetical protein
MYQIIIKIPHDSFPKRIGRFKRIKIIKDKKKDHNRIENKPFIHVPNKLIHNFLKDRSDKILGKR